MHKECCWIEKHLIELIEGTVMIKESPYNIEQHLLFCSRCADLIGKLQTAWKILESPERIDVSCLFESTLLKKVESLDKSNIFIDLRDVLLTALRPAILLGGLMLAVFFGYHLGNFSENKAASLSSGNLIEKSYFEYSSDHLTVLNNYFRGSASDFLLNINITPKEDSP